MSSDPDLSIQKKGEGSDKNRRTIPRLGSVLKICVGQFDGVFSRRSRPVPDGESGVNERIPRVVGICRVSHESDVVVIVHLYRSCQRRVSLAEDGPRDPYPLTFHEVGRCFETEMKIPKRRKRNNKLRERPEREGRYMSLTPLARDGK